MGALAADRNTKTKEGDLLNVPVAELTTIYAGSMVCLNTSGYAVPAADTVGFIYLGVANENVDNSAGTNGALDVDIVVGKEHSWACSGMSQAKVGLPVYAYDDQTVVLDGSSTTNKVYVGTIARYVSATEVWVKSRDLANLVPQFNHALWGGAEFDLTVANEQHDLIPASANRTGLLVVLAAGIVTEVLGGGTQDQGVVTIYDGDDTSLGTITFADAGADVIGDVRFGIVLPAATAGDAAKSVAAAKKIYGKVTTACTGTSAAGEVKVAVQVLPLGPNTAA